MPDYKIIEVRNQNPEWEHPTYEFDVLLDTEKVLPIVDYATDRLGNEHAVQTSELGPDPDWVRTIVVSTAPVGKRAPFTTEEVLQIVDERVKAFRHDLIRDGVIYHPDRKLTMNELKGVS